MAKRVVIDPITRIEGHLRVEVVVDDNNKIIDAYSSATLWRGIEVILKGRDPRDAGMLAMRICGVCTYSHYLKSTMAVEDALGIKIPYNAELVRTLMNAALFMHDHVVHFYHLHGVDWVDITSALKSLCSFIFVNILPQPICLKSSPYISSSPTGIISLL